MCKNGPFKTQNNTQKITCKTNIGQKFYLPFSSHLIVYKQLRTFEISGSNSDIIFLARMVKLSQTPVYQPQLKGEKKIINKCVFQDTLHNAIRVLFFFGHIVWSVGFLVPQTGIEPGPLAVKNSPTTLFNIQLFQSRGGV